MRTLIFVLAIAIIMLVTIQWIAVSVASASGAAETTVRASFPEPVSTAIIIGVSIAMLLWKIARKSGWV